MALWQISKLRVENIYTNLKILGIIYYSKENSIFILTLLIFFVINKTSRFCGKNRNFVLDYYIFYEFHKNIPICNKISFSSKSIGFSSSKTALLLLEKAFLYSFSICQQVK